MQEEQEYNKLIWFWNKKPIVITKLEDNQLYSIKESILRNKPKKWFGIHNKVWINAINDITKERTKRNMQQIVSEISNRRIKRASSNADLIMNGIIKSFNKNNYERTNS